MKKYEDVICSEEYNMTINRDVLDDIVEDIIENLKNNPTIKFLKKHGISIDVKYDIDNTLWQGYFTHIRC